MALGDAPHHLGFPSRAKGGAAALPRLDGDQFLDDAAPLHQKRVHGGVDPIDVDAQVVQSFGGALVRHGAVWMGCEARCLPVEGCLAANAPCCKAGVSPISGTQMKRGHPMGSPSTLFGSETNRSD